LEMGQPNHTFDFDFLQNRANEYSADNQIHIITRLAQENETLTTLDGKEHKLHSNNLLVTDPIGNLSLSGIMGGHNSEIQDNTTNVLLEAAAWNFINIRHSSRQLALHTEAGFRFSRGVHPSQAMLGAKRAAELLRTLAGGTVAEGIYDYYPAQPESISVTLPLDYARKLSGLDLSMAEIAALLERLEFGISELADDHLVAIVPDHRIDVEGKHDLVEEFCRVYGYGNIPSTVLRDTLPTQRGNPTFEAEANIKDILVQLGMQEIITYRLTTRAAEAKALAGTPDDRPYVSLANPSTLERVDMRHNLLASVLDIAAENSKFVDRVAIFELGHVYIKDEEAILPTESPRLALALTGSRGSETWQDGVPPQFDFYDVKGLVDGLLAALNVSVRYESAEHPSFRPGRTAKLMLGKSQKQLGVIGELHPLVIQQYEMRVNDDQPVLAADLNLELLLANIPPTPKVNAIPDFPPVREDLALIVDNEVASSKVEAAIRKAGGYLLKNVSLFDVYTGDKVAAGKKSLAYHLTFQSPSKTLKDKDIAKMRKKILGTTRAMVGATLRE
ncbi:MAG: phenylalanine--tRNA ligase subunit beta, partial [Candidatus Promineifilaceae bacterium]